MRQSLITEQDLERFNENMRKIKGTVGNANANREDRLGPVKNVAPTVASPQYRSKWEAAYANKLELEKRAGHITGWRYEPFSLWLPGKIRYKPDFMVWRECGDGYGKVARIEIEIIEVKGWSRNRRDGITRLKIAAALFPCFVWRMVYRTKGGGWDGEYL